MTRERSVERSTAAIATFTPYIENGSPSIPANVDAYIPVRVPRGPQPDGSMLVYLPDATGFVVNSRHLLRLDPDQNAPGTFRREVGLRPMTGRPTAVVADALLRRGEPLHAARQTRAVVSAARVIANAVREWRLAITHGNGRR